MTEITLTLSKDDLQDIVDYLVIQHDSLFEFIINNEDGDGAYHRDELVISKFLLQAKEKGINIDKGLYKWDNKISRLNNISKGKL